MRVGGKLIGPGNFSEAVPVSVFPLRGMLTVGLAGSLLVIVRVHDFDPADVGVKSIWSGRPESGLIVVGNSPGFTKVKSRQPALSATEVTSRLQVPTLLICSVCGAVALEQLAVPKFPLPVTLIVPFPSLPVATNWNAGVFGSSLLIWNVAV